MPTQTEKPFTDSNELDNPHRLGNESAAENYASYHESTYKMLHDEMKGRVHVDQDSVWTRLQVHEIDDDLVKSCCQQLRVSCAAHIAGLKDVTERARKAGSGIHEVEMYPYLVRVFAAFLSWLISWL